MKFKALIAGAVAVGTLLGSASLAGATAPEPSGWDDINDIVVGGGSDTTYRLMQEVELLYNQSQGCETNNTNGSPTIGRCLTPANQATEIRGNWDHDYFVGKFPTGSSAGVTELINGTVDYARSSRGPRNTGESALNFWAFGKDGLAMITTGTRAPGNITKAQIQGIYNCTITSWQQITGNPADAGQTIEPVGMNSSSGTFASFQTYLGFDPNAGACVKKIDPDGAGPQAAFFPFENDVKQLNNSPTTININNAFWWMSYAEFRAWNFKRQSAQAWNVEGTTPGVFVAPSSASISNNSYPLTRFIYHVTKKADATPDGATENVLGADGGKGGAVREITEWMCKGSTSHAFNDYTGLTQYQELGNRYTLTGFIRVPAAERTNGICRVVPGP